MRSHFLQFICHGNRHSTGLQGTSARAMASICVHRATRTPPDIAPRHIGSRDGLQEDRRPATHSPQSPVGARSHTFLQFICHGNRHSTGLQGTSARAMAPICVHRAPRTPPDIATRHIGSRDGLQEEPRPATELPHTAVRARLVPGPTLSCNSSVTAIAILEASRAYPLARWHRFVSIARPEPLQTSLQGTSARAMISRKNPDLPHTAVSARSLAFLQFI